MQVAVKVPAPLVTDPELTASAKYLWMRLRVELPGDSGRISVRGLERTGLLARNTVRVGLDLLEKLGWLELGPPGRGRRWVKLVVKTGQTDNGFVAVPTDFIRDPDSRLTYHARVLYACLQLVADSAGLVLIDYDRLCSLACMGESTARRSLQALEDCGWIRIRPMRRNRRLVCELRDAILDALRAEKEAIDKRIRFADSIGEGLMLEIIRRLVDDDEYELNSRPVWLVNPQTGERMEFDCYFSVRRVAIEFNGPQHYHPTEMFSNDEAVRKQQERDLFKLGLAVLRNVRVIIIRTEDLRVDIVRDKLRDVLPLRDLPDDDPILGYLDAACRRYQKAARRKAS